MRNKKILFAFGFSYCDKERTGVGEYTYNFLKSCEYDFYVLAPKNYKNDISKYAHIINVSSFHYILFKIFRYILPFELFFGHFDIIFSDAYIPHTLFNTKKIVIVHDLMSKIYPQYYSKKQKLTYYFYYKSIRNNKKVNIIAVSETTKVDLIRLLNISSDRITVIPNTSNFYIKYKPLYENKYILYIGAMRKNKNLLNLIKGFQEYLIKFNSNDVKLYIAGSKNHEYVKLKKYVDDNDLNKKIIFTGYVNAMTKEKLYSNCAGLVFVSEYEGFGIPLLEASNNNIPILASNISAHKEVAENACYFCEYNDISSIANGINDLITKDKDFTTEQNLVRNKYSFNNFKLKVNIFIQKIIN